MGHIGGDASLDDLVTRVLDTRRRIARMQAAEAELLAEAADLVLVREQQRREEGKRAAHDLPLREVTSELGAAMRLSDRAVQQRMSAASTLIGRFPETAAALREGRIDSAHADAVVDAGTGLSDAAMRAAYEQIVLEAARFETPYRLRALARVVAARIDPALLEELQARARRDRKVRVIDLGDGMARLLADLPAVLAHAIHDRLTQMGHEVRDTPVETAQPDSGAGDSMTFDEIGSDERTMDQLRADILTDLLLTATPTAHGDGDAFSAIRAHVQITVPVLTAAGRSDEPALLAGYGPIDAQTARELAGDASGWDRVMFHPHTGAPLAVDRYCPSAELRRFLRVRDERCRFPGCTQKPWRSDLDHTTDHALGGRTSADNLAHLCRRHHTVKHATAWKVTQTGHGTLEWISLTGRGYLDKPPSTVRFVPSTPGPELVDVPF